MWQIQDTERGYFLLLTQNGYGNTHRWIKEEAFQREKGKCSHKEIQVCALKQSEEDFFPNLTQRNPEKAACFSVMVMYVCNDSAHLEPQVKLTKNANLRGDAYKADRSNERKHIQVGWRVRRNEAKLKIFLHFRNEQMTWTKVKEEVTNTDTFHTRTNNLSMSGARKGQHL